MGQSILPTWGETLNACPAGVENFFCQSMCKLFIKKKIFSINQSVHFWDSWSMNLCRVNAIQSTISLISSCSNRTYNSRPRLFGQLNFVKWNKNGWKVGLCDVAGNQPFSLLGIHNTTAVNDSFINLRSRFVKLYKRKGMPKWAIVG